MTEPADTGATTFSDFLQLINHGDAEITASERLRDVLDTLRNHAAENQVSAKGSITVKIDLTLERGMLKAKAAISTKTPTPPATEATLFLSREGNPTAHDPRQGRLNFATTNGGAGEAAPRTV
ncbi:hypothetical protein [Oceanicella sp. SM1341]|uniref:hypothetical protein n=1 Tax=Oceanicella sp. SM1341 TaxID=1548889 RepID=UPI000E48A8CB|nr:hypothetical protein [Oceanicella sp. SM1341]